jgi:cytoskeleton protein RodZ
LETFGERLKLTREQRGMTLEQVSSSTKIGVRFLRALEEEHFEKLPGGIFNKGFVRSYARTVGANEEETIAAYLAASGLAATGEDLAKKPLDDPETPLSHPAGAEASWQIRTPVGIPRHGLTLALVALLLVASVVFLALRSRQLNGGAGEFGLGGAAGSKAGTQNTSSAAGRGGPTATPARFPDGRPRPGEFVVKIKASDDSWLLITADGKQIMQDTLAAEEEKSITAQKEIVIKAGNVGGLDFWFNGTRLASQGEFGNVRTLIFDGRGLRAAEGGGSTPPE